MNITIDANFGMAVNPVVNTVLDFSDKAARKVKKLIEEEGNPSLKLRVSVYGGGCSGFQYSFSLDEEIKDWIVEKKIRTVGTRGLKKICERCFMGSGLDIVV